MFRTNGLLGNKFVNYAERKQKSHCGGTFPMNTKVLCKRKWGGMQTETVVKK